MELCIVEHHNKKIALLLDNEMKIVNSISLILLPFIVRYSITFRVISKTFLCYFTPCFPL